MTTGPKRCYVLAPFALIIAGLSAFMYQFKHITFFYQVSFFSILILSTVICGGVLENKKWVIAAEYLRLALVVACLDSYYYFWHLNWFNAMAFGSTAAIVIFAIWFTRTWLPNNPATE